MKRTDTWASLGHEGGAPDRAGIATATLVALLFAAILAFAAPAANADFGFKSLSSTFTGAGGVAGDQRAGSHPEAWTTELSFNTTGPPGSEHPDGTLRDLRVGLPPGLVGSPGLLPVCSRADFVADACPASTSVGSLGFLLGDLEVPPSTVYLLEPRPGFAAQLGIHVLKDPVTIDLTINPSPPHNVLATIVNAPNIAELFSLTLTLEGAPHGSAFLTLPRACPGPLTTTFAASSLQSPQTTVTATAPEPEAVIACSALSYSPSLRATATTTLASSPSGLDLELSAPDPGISSPGGRAAADTERAVLRLPPGMTINPPLAAGLAACTPGQFGAEAPDSDPATGCPETSRVGYAEVETPLFAKPISGSLYVATPDDPATAAPGAENPFDTRFALYLVLRDPERGVLVSLPIRVDADPGSGRLTATLTQIPQLPLSQLELHFNSGPHAPLTTPAACGTATIAYTLTPSAGGASLEGKSPLTVDRSCPSGTFAPTFDAGTASNFAGTASAFVLALGQSAAEPALSGLTLTLPPGLSASFATVDACPEAAAVAGVCPPDSRLGYARLALGSGTDPLWVPTAAGPDSAVYLAGPYRGAPYSLLISVPAVAGPYDLGTVAVRAAIRIDPETAQARVDLDPLPQILGGVPLHYRSIRLVLDRPAFIRNPTSCAAAAITATATAATGVTATAGSRFQAADCAALAFKPRVAVRLLGSSHRGAHPGLRAVFAPRAGDANLRRAALTLPGTELLDSRHIRAVCSRTNFAAKTCPPASAYGSATVWSPLLKRPLRGPVYLRGSHRRLPDLVASLDGELHLDLAAQLGARKGRIRVGFDSIPDMPVTKVSLRLAGGRRGLLVNSGGLCRGGRRARVGLEAQSGKGRTLRPLVKTPCAPAAWEGVRRR
ncbi:MAG TPA: hypothetical protein VFN18_02480 [Solirubrobacterales bacterium]|nr:hypothetical protein [Solirubrobacterales bacterium]